MTELIIIGLGLNDGKDIAYKGLEKLREVDIIFGEFYTAKMAEETVQQIESLIDKKILILTRDQVEDGTIIFNNALKGSVAFVCQGDPLTATTHIELLIRAKQLKIPTQLIHASSVVTAVPGLLGLQFYKFGRTTTLAFPDGAYFPESPYEVIIDNLKRGLHTLVLLDIDAQKNRYMTANEGIDLLLKISSKREDTFFSNDTLICVVARAGADDPKINADLAGKLVKKDFGGPLHTIVIPGKLHFKEAEGLIILADAPENVVKKYLA